MQKTDPSISEVSAELGRTVQAVFGFAIDSTQDVAGFALQQLVATQRLSVQARSGLTQIALVVVALGRMSLVAPILAGRMATKASLLTFRTGLLLLRTARRAVGASD